LSLDARRDASRFAGKEGSRALAAAERALTTSARREREMRWLADYTIGLVIVISHMVMLSLTDGRPQLYR
jgi:hypothetical protein